MPVWYAKVRNAALRVRDYALWASIPPTGFKLPVKYAYEFASLLIFEALMGIPPSKRVGVTKIQVSILSKNF